ncbi:hypothetical protein OAU50_05315 [Planctomycetota bacterium]|nr:hypothetical protein [Planctomycetota bacterium]
MRQANWHEEGGNAKRLKGTVEQANAEHQGTSQLTTKTGRGSVAQDQPSHEQAVYPKFKKRR